MRQKFCELVLLEIKNEINDTLSIGVLLSVLSGRTLAFYWSIDLISSVWRTADNFPDYAQI